jgi:hypothetical protein
MHSTPPGKDDCFFIIITIHSLCSLKCLVFVVSQFDLLLLFSMAFSPSFFVSLSLALCGLFGVGQCALKVMMIHPIMIYIFKIWIGPFSSKVGLVCWIRYFECLWNMQCPLSIRRRLYSTTSSSLSSSGRHQSERFLRYLIFDSHRLLSKPLPH